MNCPYLGLFQDATSVAQLGQYALVCPGMAQG